MTWVEVFPFPEVNAKNGHGARNKYFPTLCRDCAISPLGRGALDIPYFQSKRLVFTLSKFLPGIQIVHPALWLPTWGWPRLHLALLLPSQDSWQHRRAQRAQRRVSVQYGGWRQASQYFMARYMVVKDACTTKWGLETAHTASTHVVALLTFLPSDSCVPSGLTTAYVSTCVLFVHMCLCVRVRVT